MIDSRIAKVHEEPIHLAHAENRQRQIAEISAIAVCIVLLCTIALPVLYAWVPTRTSFAEMLRGRAFDYILMNCAANALVLADCLMVKGGRLEKKIARNFATVLTVHGTLALGTLLTRFPHSNLILGSAVLVSLAGGLAVIYTRHRVAPANVALIGNLSPPELDMIQGSYTIIDNPRADLRQFDVVVATDLMNLSVDWAHAVSRAMAAGKRIRHLADFSEEQRGLVSIDHFDLEHLPAGGLSSYRTRKRLLDVAIVFFTLPIILPIALAAALMIRASMGGPVLFVQERVGMGGRPFKMYKLRTMRLTPPHADSRATEEGDARVTPLGRVLRRYRIDELPQVWNVLRGDMSIVGPRPEWVILGNQYSAAIPVYVYRHLVRPGITGWAQVRGGYAGNLAETQVKIGYDLYYLKNFSFSMDMQILVRTVWTLISGHGAR